MLGYDSIPRRDAQLAVAIDPRQLTRAGTGEPALDLELGRFAVEQHDHRPRLPERVVGGDPARAIGSNQPDYVARPDIVEPEHAAQPLARITDRGGVDLQRQATRPTPSAPALYNDLRCSISARMAGGE